VVHELVLIAQSRSLEMSLAIDLRAFLLDIGNGMDAEQTIADIERLERIFAAPDTRPLSASDFAAANRRHDEMLAHSPWFRIWQDYGVCCR
jgi:hypothetical protein